MGAVAMKERSTGLVDRGYPVSEATIYIYCDNCGSFNIKTYIPFIKLLIIAVMIIVVGFLISGSKNWLSCVFPLMFISIFIPWKDILLKYKCRKCGNAHITNYNSLHYQAHDLSVVGVPDNLTQKRYIDTDVLHFQQFNYFFTK